MKNINWNQIQPGQIIKFTYKSMGDKRGISRVVLVLDPSYKYKKKSTGRAVKFVVGLELDTFIKPPITKQKFEKLIKTLGGLSLDEGVKEVGDNPDKVIKQDRTKNLYNSIKFVIEKQDLFRTYFLRECRKRRVFLLDNYERFPKKALSDLKLKKEAEQSIKKIGETRF
jgi:hypothetical protein|tara:strand:+ start:3572 stop:4078 length:507 start_codon:yes stop_codon:yes gene_type:complete